MNGFDSLIFSVVFRLFPISNTAYRSKRHCGRVSIGTAVARRMNLSEREVADVFYVSLLFHVGVAYAQETFELFGDDQAVRRAAVETDLTDMRDIVATLIPGATCGLLGLIRFGGRFDYAA